MKRMPFSAAIADAPLRPYQVLVALFGLAMLVIDGIDLQSLSLVTPVILEEWTLIRSTKEMQTGKLTTGSNPDT